MCKLFTTEMVQKILHILAAVTLLMSSLFGKAFSETKTNHLSNLLLTKETNNAENKINVQAALKHESLHAKSMFELMQHEKQHGDFAASDKHFGKSNRERKKRHKQSKKRRSRTLHSKAHFLSSIGQTSCATKSSYVQKRTAVDIFNEEVDVYPVIQVGNLSLDQYFHETFCDIERCACKGIDKQYKSSCETTYSFSYARVVKDGKIGWSYIKLRSGCSCIIKPIL